MAKSSITKKGNTKLILSQKEATVLKTVLSNISGDPDTTARRETEDIRLTLGHIPYEQWNDIHIIGELRMAVWDD